MKKFICILGFFIFAFMGCIPLTLASKAGFSMDVAKPAFDFSAHFPQQGETWNITEELNLTTGSAVQAALFINDRVRVSYGDFLYDSALELGNKNGILRAALNSQWNLSYAGLGYFQPFHLLPGIQSEAIVDLKGYRFRTRAAGGLRNLAAFESEWIEMEGIIPALGLKLTKNVSDFFHVYGEVIGIPSNSLASYVDWDAGVRYEKADLAVQMGIRQIAVKAPYSLLQAELRARFSGPYFGLAYSF